MERRALTAVAISLFILVIYQGLLLPTFYPAGPHPTEPLSDSAPAAAPADAAAAPDSAAVAAPAAAPAPAAAEEAVPDTRLVVETDQFIATIQSRGARLESFALKKYGTTVERDSPPQDVIVPGANQERPLGIELRGADNGGGVALISDAAAGYHVRSGAERTVLTGDQSTTIELEWNSPGGTIRKAYTFHGNRPDFSVDVHGENIASQYREIGISYVGGEKAGKEVLFDRVSYLQGRKLIERHVGASDLTEGEILPSDPGWVWSAFVGRYFVAAIVPIDLRNGRLWIKQRETTLEQKLLLPVAGSSFDQQIDVYLGSKRIETLEAVGHNLGRAVDMGWFSFIALPLLWLLRHSHQITGNYGIDIILLTVMIKILFLPLTRKSFESMRAMQQLQPQMQQLREQYKDKPEEMNKQVMELYRRHGVNPLGGCLPMLVQIPVFIGLYQALSNAVELRHAPFFLWITDLSAPDRLGTLAIPFVDPPGIPVLTLVMGATMFVQQWMSPSTGDPTQRQMMMIMPLMFTFMFVNFPAGLVLYWTVNNVLTVAQQYYITRNATA